MADFSLYYPRLLRNEGGYCHRPADPGGETYKGIARHYHPEWVGWARVDAAKAQLKYAHPVPAQYWPNLTRALAQLTGLDYQVQAFYKAEYWDCLHLDQVSNQSLAEQVCDHGVNAGTARPGRMLQYCLRLMGHPEIEEDGQLGRDTLRVLNAVDQAVLYQSFTALRIACYRYRAAALYLTAGPRLGEQFGQLTPELRDLFGRLKIKPDAAQAQFLIDWLTRVRVLKFSPTP